MKFKYSILKKFFLLTALILIACLSGIQAQAEGGTWKGTGTPEDPYLIESVEDLQELGTYVNGGNSCLNMYFLLTNDLDLSGVCGEGIGNWVPIGTESRGFDGVFSGGLHTIKGLYINESENKNLGLFGVVMGKVERLSVSGSVSGMSQVGGIAGVNQGTIKGCGSTVTVMGSSAVGGIAGFNEGVLQNCFNGGNVTGKTSVGGIAGESGQDISYCTNEGNISSEAEAGGIVGCLENARIEFCVNKGEVESKTRSAGGITGAFTWRTKDSVGHIFYCINDGKVSALYGDVGGIVGYAHACDLKECINTGDVSGEQNAGGIAGNVTLFGSLIDSTNRGKITGTQCTGGIAGTTDISGKIDNCFNDGEISGETFCGGIVGQTAIGLCYNYALNTVGNCTNEGKITGTKMVGGIVGSGISNVAGCINRGQVSGSLMVGGIIGNMADEKNSCEKCVNTNTVSGENMVGGIIGNCFDISVKYCRNEGAVKGIAVQGETSQQVGGIIGSHIETTSNNQNVIELCRNEGPVENEGNATGGIVGTATKLHILKCENSAGVSAGGINTGGIAGSGDRATIERCGNTGEVSAMGNSAGGIAGRLEYSSILDSFNRGNVSANDCAGGLAGVCAASCDMTGCYVKASAQGITCKINYGHVGGLYGNINSSSSTVAFAKCYWWSECADRALGSNDPGASDLSGEGYKHYRNGAMFLKFDSFDSWNFTAIWRLDSSIGPQLRNDYDFSSEGGKGADEKNGEIVGAGYHEPHLNRINNLDDFKAFRDAVNGGDSYAGETVYLLADLDLSADSGTYWEPVGTENHPFGGWFYGGNHIIKNLQVSTSEYAGLFGSCRGAVRDLAVYGTVKGSGLYAGGIAGCCDGSINNCFFFGDVSCTYSDNAYVGGIVGILSGGGMTDCGHIGLVSVAKGYAGGIAGHLNRAEDGLSHCFHYGEAGSVVCAEGYQGSIVGSTQFPEDINGCYTSLGSAAEFVGRNRSSGDEVKSCMMLDENGFRDPKNFAGWNIGDDTGYDRVMGWDYPLPAVMSDYVTIDCNNGSGEKRKAWMIRSNMVVGDFEPVLSGYSADGWNDQADGNGKSYAKGEEVPAHITLYAQFVKGGAYHGYIPFEPEDKSVVGSSEKNYEKLFDGNTGTKWFTSVPANAEAWALEFATKDYVRPNGYYMVTGDDTASYPGRNPSGWKLEGLDPDGTWKVIDEVTDDQTLPGKNGAKAYKALNNTEEYCQFRITFTGVKSGDIFQLAEFFLTVEDPEKDVRKPRITLDPNTVSIAGDKVVKTGDNRSEITLGGDPYGPEAYKFLSWNTDPNGRGDRYKADNPFQITKDTTVYAEYQANRYELIVKLEKLTDSPVYRRITYTTDTEFKLTPPERDGYVFLYWIVTVADGSWKLGDTFGAGTDVHGKYGNATLDGVWEKREEVTVRWYNEGQLLDEETYYVGDTPEYKGEEPAFDGGKEYEYTFIGWDKKFEELAGDTDFNAVYKKTKKEYEITWKDENGNKIDSTMVKYGEIPAHSNLSDKETKEFYFEFVGWDPEIKAVTGPAEYSAKYSETRKSYPIHFVMNGASAIKDASVEYGSTVKKPDVPEYSGFVFDGWFADPECKTPYTFEEKIMDETTIYAKWTAIQSAPKLTDSEKPVAKTEITANGQPVALIDAPQNVPEGYTVQYSLDGKTWSTEIPTGTKSGVYTVHIFYKGDDYHEDFYGDDITVTLRGVYNCDATTSEWTKGSGKTVEFRFKKEFNDEDCFERFTGILVDGKAAERDKDYTAVKGSTIITFSAEFLETLELGDHSVKALFEDGEATVGIKVVEPAPATPAKDPAAPTGDSSNLVLWIILALVSIVSIGVLIVVKRKKKSALLL